MEKWYAKGLRFSCTKCGRCCTGGPGAVWVTLDDINRISEHLGVDSREFSRRCVRLIDDRLSLIERTNYDCILLRDNKCSAYPVRPLQCRTFPFWQEIMDDELHWIEATAFCPGVGNGRLYTAEEVEKIMEGKDETRSFDRH